jgi:hypothetical protein
MPERITRRESVILGLPRILVLRCRRSLRSSERSDQFLCIKVVGARPRVFRGAAPLLRCLSAIRFRFLTRVWPACRRKPSARLPPPRLRDQPSRAARSFRRKTSDAVSRGRRANTPLLLTVSREAPFRLLPRSRRRARVAAAAATQIQRQQEAVMSSKQPECHQRREFVSEPPV